MMAVGAFNQVHAALRWFVDNIGGIADWRATLLRIAAFRSALLKVDELHDVEKRIAFAEAEAGHLTFDEVEVSSPAGCTKLADAHVDIGVGERVVVTGDPGAGKTLFFRAIAGLWPWGGGRIGLPKGETVTFIPRTPYFPPGSLSEVLCYPLGTADFRRRRPGCGPHKDRPRAPRVRRSTMLRAGTASSTTRSSGCWHLRGSPCTSRAGWSSTRHSTRSAAMRAAAYSRSSRGILPARRSSMSVLPNATAISSRASCNSQPIQRATRSSRSGGAVSRRAVHPLRWGLEAGRRVSGFGRGGRGARGRSCG